MNFILGLMISALLIVCLLLEMCEAIRPIFSVILLLGVIAFAVAIFLAGILLTPLFIVGFLINIPILIIAILSSGGDKDVK